MSASESAKLVGEVIEIDGTSGETLLTIRASMPIAECGGLLYTKLYAHPAPDTQSVEPYNLSLSEQQALVRAQLRSMTIVDSFKDAPAPASEDAPVVLPRMPESIRLRAWASDNRDALESWATEAVLVDRQSRAKPSTREAALVAVDALRELLAAVDESDQPTFRINDAWADAQYAIDSFDAAAAALDTKEGS